MSLLLAVAPLSATRVGEQAAKTFILVVVLLVGFRLAGKREIAQFTVYDLAMVIALSNAVQNAMTGGLGNFEIGLVTSSTLVLTAWVISRVIARRPRLEAEVFGTPTLLVNDGRVLTARCRAAKVSPEEIAEACREHGVDGPRDCHLAVLEVDGSISVVARAEPEPDRPPPPA
ncbi:MAG TPA: YetF domain-containing protein [Acidimicrobiia bacterium]|nr:YetF domain-containing protein [Acidimicrobiia bacterium]